MPEPIHDAPAAEETVENTTEDSSTETTKTENTHSNEGGEKNTQSPAPVPFHEDPKVQDYIERQMATREAKLRDEFEGKLKNYTPVQKKEEENVPIPEWFGGDEKQWKAYRADQQRTLEDERKRAVDEAFERINVSHSTQTKAVQEANEHFDSSIKKLETESGQKIDRNELLKFVLDNKIIDAETQRWDYVRGYRWMQAEKVAAQTKGDKNKVRKDLAGATTNDSGGKGGAKDEGTVRTSEDFQSSANRPW